MTKDGDLPLIVDGVRRASGELPHELAEALRGGEFHQVLRVAIAHRGLSLARLRAHLALRGVQIGQSTLSYWQRGLRQPEVPKALPAVRALESVLQLPADSLVLLLSPRLLRRGHQPAVSFHDLRSGDMGSIVDQLLAELGSRPQGGTHNADLELLAVHDTLTFDAEHRQVSVSTRLVVRARRHGPDRYVTVYNGDPGCSIDDVELITHEGCRVGRMRRNCCSTGSSARATYTSSAPRSGTRRGPPRPATSGCSATRVRATCCSTDSTRLRFRRAVRGSCGRGTTRCRCWPRSCRATCAA